MFDIDIIVLILAIIGKTSRREGGRERKREGDEVHEIAPISADQQLSEGSRSTRYGSQTTHVYEHELLNQFLGVKGR